MLELVNLRNREFVRRYRQLRDLAAMRRQPLKHSDLICDTIMSGAPCYYTTFDYAYRMLRQLRRDGFPDNYNKLRLSQWKEIAHKVDRIKESLHVASDHKALGIVLSRSSASRFFISKPYAERLLRRLLQGSRHRKCGYLKPNH